MGTTPIRGVLVTAVAALALIAAGCNSTPTEVAVAPSALSQQQANDLASQLGSNLKTDSGVAMLEMNAAASSATSAAAGVFGTSAAQGDTSFTAGGVSFFFSIAFFNAAGDELPGYDPTAVRIRITTIASGSVSEPGVSATVGHAAVLDITGIEPENEALTFNGTADDTLNASFTSPSEGDALTDFSWTSAVSYVDVVKLKDDSINPYPLSGVLNFAIHAIAAGVSQGNPVTIEYNATAKVTFNGTAFPTVVIDGTYTYQLNLDTGEAIPV